jgi:hypothetical protein
VIFKNIKHQILFVLFMYILRHFAIVGIKNCFISNYTCQRKGNLRDVVACLSFPWGKKTQPFNLNYTTLLLVLVEVQSRGSHIFQNSINHNFKGEDLK